MQATTMANSAATSKRGWSVIKNEDRKGQNPYSISHPEMEKLLTARKRNKTKER